MSPRLTSRPFTLALIALLVLAPAFQAQALTIAPARMELTGDPGTNVTGEFVIINEEEGSRTFYTSAQNFEARGETGTPNFVDGDTGLASWVTVAPEITLTQGEKQTVPFSIAIPANADAGGHFAAIFLSTVPPGDAQVSIGAKVGVLLLLRVAGDVTEAAGVSDFGADRFFSVSTPVGFSYRFSNDGGDRVNPRGDIVIRNLIGLKKAVVPANPSEGNVLPGSTRKFEASWGDTAETRPSGFFAAVGYELKHFAFGPYRAKLALAYGVDGSASDSAWVFLFPWHLLTIVLVIILVLLPFLRYGLRRYNRWIIAKAQQRS